QKEEAVDVIRALMEMKHLGSTLSAPVYAPSPQVLGLTESRATPSAHPLWDIASPGDPVTPAVFHFDQASCPRSLRPAEAATAHLEPEAILGHYLWPGTGAVSALLYGLQPHSSVGSVWERHYRLQMSYSTPGLTGPLYSVQRNMCPATEK
ncbi:hypothetical protein KUCAC02_012237, partial [Chaenocephalus aceratus]